MIDYSVIIRTTGNAHEKYQILLDSIENLEPKPKEIIVVLPDGAEIPTEKLGWETFYFCPKGMVIQRMTGISKCRTKYALVCDDDVKFDKDFVQKLYDPISQGKCRLSAGPLCSFFPSKGGHAMLCAVLATAVPTVFHKDRYVSILKSAGYSYNRNLDSKKSAYYETQSVAWTCFFGEIQAIKEIELEHEEWLDSHGYAYLDDQTMFYKAWIRNIKTIVVSDALYEHLDARTSVKNNKEPVLRSTGFNLVVFWHRFLFSMQKSILPKLTTSICFIYRVLLSMLFDLVSLLRRKLSVHDFKVKYNGMIEGWKYVASDQYKKLPPIKEN